MILPIEHSLLENIYINVCPCFNAKVLRHFQILLQISMVDFFFFYMSPGFPNIGNNTVLLYLNINYWLDCASDEY